jgi:indoleamine 2,3-dioxygenase
MRKYMPGPHRRFLEHVERVANIKGYVNENRHDRELTMSFDAALAMLRAMRDKHLQIVSRYIVVQTHSSTSKDASQPTSPKLTRRSLATSIQRGDSRKLRGTGGTALMAFLKQARDETGEGAIDAWARRMLNNGPGSAANLKEGYGVGVARLGKMSEHLDGAVEVVGLAGTWSVDDSEGGVCLPNLILDWVFLLLTFCRFVTGRRPLMSRF